MTLKQARAMAGRTTWASHSREEVDAALALVEAALTTLEQRFAEATERSFREGRVSGKRLVGTDDAAWLASEAKKGLT